MKRFIRHTALMWFVIVSIPTIRGQQPLPEQQPPLTREAVEALIDSPEFAQLTQELMPGSPQMQLSPQEREQVIQDTLREVQRIEKMTPEQQQEELQHMFEGLQPPQQPQQPQVSQEMTRPTETQSEPARPTVAESTAHSIQDTLKHLAKNIDIVQLRIDSLLRASPDSSLERTWAQVQEDLPWTISALRRVSNNRAVVDTLGSHEYTTLIKQIRTLDTSLKRLKKDLNVPDTAQLQKLKDVDIARSQPISESEKKRSKQAATNIIQLFGSSISDITFGFRKMLEKYATDMLKELDKEKSKGPASPSTQQGAGYSPAGRRPSEWRPSSSGAGYRGYEQGPDYASYPYDYNYQSPEDSSAYGSKDALGKPTSRGAEKTGTSQEQKREQAPSKDPDADIGEAIKALQGKATAALEKMTDNVLKSTDENSPIVRAARFALNDVILACEQVHGTLAKRALAWKSLPQDTQDARLQKIEKEIQKQESVKKLTELARTKLAGAMRAGKSTPIITNLQEYLQAYEKVLDATLTTTGAQKQASDAQQELLAALNKNVDGQSILTHAQAATAPTSEAYKKALQDAFEKTQSFLMAVNKLSTRDKNKAQALLKPREIESWTKALQTGSAHADAHTAALTQELGALG